MWLKHIPLKWADIWAVLQEVLTLHNSIIDFAKSPGRKTYPFPLSSELTWWQSAFSASLKDFCSVLLRIFDNLLLYGAVRQTTWLTTGRARALSAEEPLRADGRSWECFSATLELTHCCPLTSYKLHIFNSQLLNTNMFYSNIFYI